MKCQILFALIVFGVISTFAALPSIPGTNEVVRYEIDDHIQIRVIPRARGNALLSILDGGRQLREIAYTPGMICDPASPSYWLELILTNGSTNTIGIGNCFVELPNDCYGVTETAAERITKVTSLLEEDLRREIVSAPKPMLYTIGRVNDGGTLSGVARLFYGDATKWMKIYEANKQIIKNPNIISDGMELTIPKLQ